MSQSLLLALMPWAAALIFLQCVAVVMVRVDAGKLRWRKLFRLLRDQRGGVQSLSFVLTLPLFVMVILLIVQVSQIMIGTVVVHYAAFAGARSAIVWIPAEAGDPEGANRIGWYLPDPDVPDQQIPILDPDDPGYGPAEGGVTMLVAPEGPKYEKILTAAVLACMPISPSRDLGLGLEGRATWAAQLIEQAYDGLVPTADTNLRVAARLRNKLAYAMSQTRVEVRFFHPNSEPPLVTHFVPHDPGEFYFNELGWQDQITVTVHHNMALLPGPGRLLARPSPRPEGGTDRTAQRIGRVGNVYTLPLSASITLGNEGRKSMIPYQHAMLH